MTIIAGFFIISGVLLSIFVYLDTQKHKQAMSVMNIVWPLTMLWASWLGFAAYLSFGREKGSMPNMNMGTMDMDAMPNMDNGAMDKSGASKMKMASTKPTWQGISLSTLHCGAGCTLADIIGESLASVIGLGLISGWVLDYALALLIGVYFQYMAIQQMGRMQPKDAITKAIKVDFLSLSAWQVGMYGFMGLYLAVLAGGASRLSFEFWFAMQIAMLAGFVVGYPMNKWLIHKGIKHAM